MASERKVGSPLEYIVTLENGEGGVDFQASQCIPMGSNLTRLLPLTLELGVGIA